MNIKWVYQKVFVFLLFFLKSWNNGGFASSSYKLVESGHSSCCRIKVIYQGTSAVANILSESEAFVWKPKRGRGGGELSFRATKRSFTTQKKQTEQETFHGINSIISTTKVSEKMENETLGRWFNVSEKASHAQQTCFVIKFTNIQK